jgi:arsenate reductase (glutaredoxin)
MKAICYHNPRCGKSRQTLQLLKDHSVAVEVIEYLKTPPTAEVLDQLLQMLAMQPRELMRKKETPYKDLSLDNSKLDRHALIEAMIANPILIERPIVVVGDKAAVGRPPEAVLSLL